MIGGMRMTLKTMILDFLRERQEELERRVENPETFDEYIQSSERLKELMYISWSIEYMITYNRPK